LLAATSKFPIKAATTDVCEDDFLRLPIGNVAIASLCKMLGYLQLVADDGWRRGNGLSHVIVLIGDRTDNGTAPVVRCAAAICDYAPLEKRELLGNGRRP
jgi:hypothetical protein